MGEDEQQAREASAQETSGGARVLVALALIGCWLTFLAPLSLAAAMLAAGGLVAAAALVQLHTGGFELEPFTVCAWLGLGFAVLLIAGTWFSRVNKPPAEGTDGPRAGFVSRLAALLGGTSVVTFAEWDGNAWLPDPLSSFLVLSCLLALVAVIPLALLWGGVRVAVALYRWSRASAFIAGMVTVIAGLLAASSVATCSSGPEGPPPDWEDTVRARTAQQVLRTAIEAEGFTQTMRALLMATAEAIDPYAFQQRTTAAIRGSRLPSPPALPAGRPRPEPGGRDPEVDACLDKLLEAAPTDLATAVDPFVARVRRSHPYLPEDELNALVVDTMLEVCLAEDRVRFNNLQAIFLNKLDLRAIDRSRRERKSCQVLAEYQGCQLSTESSMRDPELDALHDVLCGLKDKERPILMLRAVMGFRFRDIGAALEITEAKAREIFNNTRRRLKRQLEERCSASPWGGF